MSLEREDLDNIKGIFDKSVSSEIELLKNKIDSLEILTEQKVQDVILDTLSDLGHDVSNKRENQKDNIFLRDFRTKSEKFQESKLKVVWSILATVAGAAIIAWMNFD